MRSTLQLIARGLAAQGVGALLVGGHALQMHGVTRQTLDVDCLVSDEIGRVLHAILTKADYVEGARSENFVRYAHSGDAMADVDVLLVDAATFEPMLEQGSAHGLYGEGLRVPAIEHLIALKLHAIRNDPKREARDVADIVELLRRNPEIAGGDCFSGLCERYGPPSIRARIERYL